MPDLSLKKALQSFVVPLTSARALAARYILDYPVWLRHLLSASDLVMASKTFHLALDADTVAGWTEVEIWADGQLGFRGHVHESGALGTNTNASSDSRGVGVHGKAETGEGVLGETNSLNFAAVAGFQKKAESQAAGVYGESLGANAGVFGNAKGNGAGLQGLSASGIGVFGKGGRLAARFEGDVEVTGDIRLTNADCAEDFDIAGVETRRAGHGHGARRGRRPEAERLRLR
jgi:hypothetical protein